MPVSPIYNLRFLYLSKLFILFVPKNLKIHTLFVLELIWISYKKDNIRSMRNILQASIFFVLIQGKTSGDSSKVIPQVAWVREAATGMFHFSLISWNSSCKRSILHSPRTMQSLEGEEPSPKELLILLPRPCLRSAKHDPWKWLLWLTSWPPHKCCTT